MDFTPGHGILSDAHAVLEAAFEPYQDHTLSWNCCGLDLPMEANELKCPSRSITLVYFFCVKQNNLLLVYIVYFLGLGNVFAVDAAGVVVG